jgi:16S rRNA processing protein RimM
MQKQYLEVGKIVGTHGVRGELKVDSWLDDPLVFSCLKRVEVNGKSYEVLSARVQGRFALVKLEGVSSIDDALPLKNRVALAPQEDIPLPEGGHFVADLIGLDAVNEDTGEVFGKVVEIHEFPAQDVYEVLGEKRWMFPDVPEYVKGIDEETGCIRFHVVEELGQ